MANTLLVKRRRVTLRIPAVLWKRNVGAEARRATARLGFMGADHHRVRNFAVAELARRGRPLGPADVARGTGLDEEIVPGILDDLEAHLTFLYCTDGHDVDWAYPVTSQETPHRVTLDSGERFFAA